MSNALPSSSQVTLATFEGRRDGESLISCLISAGVPARLRDEIRWQRWWFLSRRHAAIHVDVPEESLDQARQCLERWRADGRDAGLSRTPPIVCPECGQSRVQYPNMTRHFLLPTLIAHLLVALRITEHECYCEDCHHTWIPESASRR